jgi:opacity protein-like surface antigen
MLKRLTILVVLMAATSAVAQAQSRIGTAVRVINKVTADQSAIITGDGVAQNQTVEVEPDALGELKLDDDTKLALGPGSKLVLDKFVYDPAKSAGSVAVNLTKGAFRFVTGTAQKKDYIIKTPSASITVRGTVFDIYIAPNGAEWILLHEGAIEVCGANNNCRKIENPCQAIGLAPAGQIGEPGGWVTRTGSSDIDFDVAFPFVKSPPLVDFTFYHTRAEVEANQCPNPNAPIKSQRAEGGLPLDPMPVYEPSTPAGSSSAGSGSPGSGSVGSKRSAPSGPSSVVVTEAPPVDDTTDTPPVIDVTSVPPAGISIYVGAQGGRGAKGNQKTEIACDDPRDTLGDPFPSLCVGGESAPSTALQVYEFDSRGFVGGGYAGIDFRAGALLIGAEADFSYAEIDSNPPRNVNGVNFPLGGSDISQNINWMSTVRARAGVGFGNVLVFATGGLAVADVDYKFKLNSDLPFYSSETSASETKTGWVAGGGIEIGFGLWSWKTEYLHYDLGRERLDSDVIDSFAAQPGPNGVTLSPEFETEGHIVRSGISFRLN